MVRAEAKLAAAVAAAAAAEAKVVAAAADDAAAADAAAADADDAAAAAADASDDAAADAAADAARRPQSRRGGGRQRKRAAAAKAAADDGQMSAHQEESRSHLCTKTGCFHTSDSMSDQTTTPAIDGGNLLRTDPCRKAIWKEKENRPSLRTFKKWMSLGYFPRIKIGGSVFLDPQQVTQALRERFTINNQ